MPGDFIFLTCHPTSLLRLCYSSWFCVFIGFLYLFVFHRTGVSDLCQLYLYSYKSIWNYCFIFRWKVIINFYKVLFHFVFNAFIFIDVCFICVCVCESICHMFQVTSNTKRMNQISSEEILCCIVFKHCPFEFLISHTLSLSYFPMCEILSSTFIDTFAL